MIRNQQKKFRLRGTRFFLTYPQYGGQLSKEDLAEHLKSLANIKEYVIAKEFHSDAGLHFHAYIRTEESLDISDPLFFDFDSHHGNYQACRSAVNVVKYCSKDGDYIQYGIDVEAYTKSKESKQAYIGELLCIKRVPIQELVKDHPELIFNYDKIKRNVNNYFLDIQPVIAYQPRTCYWIHGKPGIGKSRYIVDKYPQAYRKGQNKWWDTYKGEQVVVLDDFDCSMLGHNLKIWGDNYSFSAEVKGGTITPQYTKFFITSNYLPEELFVDKDKNLDNEIIAAIRRRFQLVTVRPIKDGEGKVKLVTIPLGFPVDCDEVETDPEWGLGVEGLGLDKEGTI